MRTNIIGGTFTILHFPGGEPHVKVACSGPRTIDARVRNFNDLGDVLAITDALKRRGSPVSLRLPYFPGARQDRAPVGEALTAKVYADIINAQNYETVSLLDPHSPVIVALLDRAIVLSPRRYISDFVRKNAITHLICPDAGAEKRVSDFAMMLSRPVIHGRKHRDPKTGKLSGFSLEPVQSAGNYLVVDDICDGGGTFLGLADEFARQCPAGSCLYLWVTHGIFSQGLDKLLKMYAAIGTTDSFYEGEANERLAVYKVEDF